MDLKASVHYRGVDLNTTNRTSGIGGGISGLQLNAVDFSPVAPVGYTEKRARGAGRDASDVYPDGRRISLQGQAYGRSRAEVYDFVRDLAVLFDAASAFDDDPAAQGYLPITFTEPTELVTFPDGLELAINARPAAAASFQIVRDLLGGADSKGGSILYQAVLEAIDPRVYVSEPVVVDLLGTGGAEPALIHRGTVPSPVMVRLSIPGSLAAGTVTLTLNGDAIVIAVLDSASQQDYLYDGAKRLLWRTTGGVTTLKLSLLTSNHRLVQPGPNTLVWSSTQALPAGSSFEFTEAFA